MAVQLPVYVIHWNAPERCSETVASLARSTGIDIQLTVIDNGSEHLPVLPDEVTVELLGRNLGYAGAANRALALAGNAPLLAIASHDVELEPTSLGRLMDFIEEHSDVGIAGPYFGRDTVPDRWLEGTLLLLRRECVADVGLFDTIFGSYCEEVDYCHRALAAGWRLAICREASASSAGRMHPDRARVLEEANFVVLVAKERQWMQVVRHLGGMARRGRWHGIILSAAKLARLAVRSLSPRRPASLPRAPQRYLEEPR